MYKIHLTLLVTLVIIYSAFSQDKPAYQLYNMKGKKVKYDKMVKDLSKSDMVFFGEYHTNPMAHWLQIELCKSLHAIKGKDLFLGAEMFENGNQLVLNEYLSGFYPESKMIPEITQMWANYKTDYKPLLDFAKENRLRFIATNIPRRYASMFHKKGMSVFNTLSKEAKAMISPDLEKYFDPTIKVYADMSLHMGGHVPQNMLNIQLAQASKDATMASLSLRNYNEGNLLLHINGSYHSNYNQGIVWWIHKIQPDLHIQTIATVTQKEWGEMTKEEKNTIANYILVVATNMTKTNR